MNLFIFETQDALAEAAATLWTKKIWDKTDMRICLAAGNTPIPLYQKMIDYYHQGQVCMRDIEAFQLNEFGSLLFSKQGELVGYTSTTVSVKTGMTVTVYNENGSCMYSRFSG